MKVYMLKIVCYDASLRQMLQRFVLKKSRDFFLRLIVVNVI